jgi:serine phosphatase RsbU (regulator of sigma subunit)/anti-sigma regulatory factor (Ser/Thr protein kinase)
MSRTAINPGGAGNRPVQYATPLNRIRRTCGQIGQGCLLVAVWVIRVVLILSALGFFVRRSYVALFVILILIGIAFAIIRTRLVSFRLLLNRSLVYSLLSVSLAVVYFGLITMWQVLRLYQGNFATQVHPVRIGNQIVVQISGNAPFTSEATIVITTLIVVMLFEPLRVRIQAFIDRRFYRSRYDAARVIAEFTATLREEIDLDQLSARLVDIVQKTLLPSAISLWLREATLEGAGGAYQLAQWKQDAQKMPGRANERPRLNAGPTPNPLHTTVPLNIEITSDDTLIAYALKTADVMEIDGLQLDSPLARALQEAGVTIALPLISHGELVGLLNLGPRLSGQRYSSDDRALLNTLSAQVAPALRVAQMVREQQVELRERERIEQELRTAQLIQRSLLPEELPALKDWRVATYYQPAREVGGDFYDFISFEDGRLGLVIGDVSDKGVPAALVMASTRSMLRAAAQTTDSPGEALARVNDLLYADTLPRMFVTCFYAILDPDNGRLRFANAGQDLPYRRHGSEICELYATGMPLGLMPGSRYDEQEVALAADERILLYSDGLVEAHNPAREMFGFPRLKQLIADHVDGASLLDRLLNELKSFTGEGWEQEDDVTLVMLQRTPERLVMTEQQEKPDRLLEWTIASAPGNEREAMERVAGAVQPLHLNAERLADLQTAVAEATMNAMEHGNHYQPDKVVAIEVLASRSRVIVHVSDQGESFPVPDELTTPNLIAKLAGLQTPRGWGLFLIKNLVDELHIKRENSHNVVELVMYRK